MQASIGSRFAVQRGRRGTALFAVVPAIVLMMALVVALLGTATRASQSGELQGASLDAESAASAAIALAIEGLWSEFADQQPIESAQPWDFELFLEARGIPDMSAAETPAPVDILARAGLPVDTDGTTRFGGTAITALGAYRLDTFDGTSLVVEATAVAERGGRASSRSLTSSIREVYSIERPDWDGLDFALLATNINCILCHTEVDNAFRFYNADPNQYGSFPEVKLGSLESLHFRSDPASWIAGSIYAGGDAMEGNGDPITDWSKFNLKSREIDEYGNIVQDAWGDMTVANLLGPDGSDAEGANLFLGAEAFESGVLPSTFPSPFPDTGGVDPETGEALADLAGNRVVDDEEFWRTVGGSDGAVTGGRISLVDHGTVVAQANELSALRLGDGSTLQGVVGANVYMHGEKNDPLRIDGDVAVDGDLVISGFVVGEGTIRARGNVYIPADLLFGDGAVGADRTYGRAPDGTQNSLAIAAGGNIVIGDFYRPAWGKGEPVTGTADGSFNFLMDEVAIFNRMEWLKTQETLPGEEVKVQVGTKTTLKDETVKVEYLAEQPVYEWQKTGKKIEQPVYKNVTTTTGTPPYQTKTTTKVLTGYKLIDETVKVQVGTKLVTKTKSVKTGNKIEVVTPVYEWQTPQHPNPHYAGPDYIARYYTFDSDDPAPIFNKEGHFDPALGHWVAEERPGAWDDAKLSYADPADASDPFLFDGAGEVIGLVSPLAPTNGWIDHEQMKKLIELNLAQRGQKHVPLEIDATLYSANAIMGIVGADGADHTDGRLLVNGGLVASDIGVLAPEGTRVNYDSRGGDRLAISSDRGIGIRRSASFPVAGR